MDPQDTGPSSSSQAGFEPNQVVEQDASFAWLDLIDWTLLDAGVWVDGDTDSFYNGDLTEDHVFQSFDGQFVEGKETGKGPQYNSTPAQGHPDPIAPGTEKTRPGLRDRRDLSSEHEALKNDRPEEAWRPERGRKQPLDIGYQSGRCAAHPSPSPRRKGRLSDLVRRGMEELKHAKGACWRCKILRKKVSSAFTQAIIKSWNLKNLLTQVPV